MSDPVRDPFQVLLASVESGLADIVDGQAERTSVVKTLLTGIESALADLIEHAEKNGAAETARAMGEVLAQAISRQPVINVAAPHVTVEAVLPPPPPPEPALGNVVWDLEVLEYESGPGFRGIKRVRITRKAG